MQLAQLLSALNASGQSACPIDMGGQRCAPVDLSRGNPALAQWADPAGTPLPDGYIQAQMRAQQVRFLWGGYAEDRDFYRLSPNFHTPGEPRSIHLGIDIWAEAGTPVRAALPGLVHSLANNAGFGNYGGTIILAHTLSGHTFYSLYGHLSVASLANWQPGLPVGAGQPLGALGQPAENGGWSPHLHFQLMADLLGHWGDFPGVAARAEQAFYLSTCPDPNLLLGLATTD
jgi:murein DD-endopeptidase MepM/ murein hydrolase activator NlpD